MKVDVNLEELMLTLHSILCKQTRYDHEDYSTKQVCGLAPTDYARVLTASKFKVISLLGVLISQIGG